MKGLKILLLATIVTLATTIYPQNTRAEVSDDDTSLPTIEISDYEVSYQLDLRDLDLTIKDGKVTVKEKPQSKGKIQNARLERMNFAKNMLEYKVKDKKANDDIAEIIKQFEEKDKKLDALAVTTVDFNEKTLSDGTKILDPIKIENKEAVLASYPYGGTPETGSGSSLTTSHNPDNTLDLYTSVSYNYYALSNYRTAWVQANLYWKAMPNQGGRDFISVSWAQTWNLSNNWKFTSVDSEGVTNASWVQPNYADNSTASIVYAFNDSDMDGSYNFYYTRGVYFGAEITMDNGSYGSKTFYSKYIHTFGIWNYTASASSAASTGLTISPSLSQYPVASHVALSF